MPSFRVIWEIDVTADDHEEAARLAWDIMRRQASISNCFDVLENGDAEPVRVDLFEIDAKREAERNGTA